MNCITSRRRDQLRLLALMLLYGSSASGNSLATILSSTRSRNLVYSSRLRFSRKLQSSVLRMHIAWARWWRSITEPSEEYSDASTELLATYGHKDY
ncbi:hypothetical protein E2C01_028046 [Portunus trituberculatus]|uniref:Uncharacterized protein n=1 Tax=Portunus trituberculatus TaxID=210409 RepID=A0A5B7EJI5_PORTR|nr:hypothetical protein [Portunus trituberculatus]